MNISEIPIFIYKDEESLGLALAEVILKEIHVSVSRGDRFLLGCPGGRSAASTYRAMGKLASERRTDMSSTVIVMMDNYVFERNGTYVHCPDNAHYSCRRFAKENIQHEINQNLPAEHRIPDTNIWLPDPAAPDEYETRIENAGGIDFFITASGASDGHVAFNPPGSQRESRTRIVTIAETTRRDNLGTFPEFSSLDEVPCFGVSVGIDTIISQSEKTALVIHGAHKKEAVSELIRRDRYDPEWPVSLFFESSAVGLFIDTSAAAGLSGE